MSHTLLGTSQAHPARPGFHRHLYRCESCFPGKICAQSGTRRPRGLSNLGPAPPALLSGSGLMCLGIPYKAAPLTPGIAQVNANSHLVHAPSCPGPHTWGTLCTVWPQYLTWFAGARYAPPRPKWFTYSCVDSCPYPGPMPLPLFSCPHILLCLPLRYQTSSQCFPVFKACV